MWSRTWHNMAVWWWGQHTRCCVSERWRIHHIPCSMVAATALNSIVNQAVQADALFMAAKCTCYHPVSFMHSVYVFTSLGVTCFGP